MALLVEPPAKLPAAARNAVLRSLLAKTMLHEIPAPHEFVGLGWRQDGVGAWIALRITDAGLAAIGVDAADAPPDDGQPTSPRPAGPAETINVPTAPLEESHAAFTLAPPLTSAEATEGAQRPPVSHHGTIGRAAALRMTAATVLAAWDAPERDGLDDALAALREVLTAAPRQPRTGTKQESVLALLRRDEGATIAQVMDATAWQQHTVRGFLAGLKRRGITIEVLERVRQVGPNKQGAKGSCSIYRIATATAPAEAG
ncbi:DUF3489 domain-containing protein [Neoroseomonas lacus]|uniref:DUF3489 domain-containing protein n=1 Tax=Neoroseomonas lacus TaxID=287609 RepID=UPI001E5BCC60|nr:DUF3489 domain-containing protein [Neoroseomonas lacus]